MLFVSIAQPEPEPTPETYDDMDEEDTAEELLDRESKNDSVAVSSESDEQTQGNRDARNDAANLEH